MVSLSLFQTLLSLNCEDVMLQLILRYLHISADPIKCYIFNRLIYYAWDSSTDFNHSGSVCHFDSFECSQVSPAL